MRRKKRYLSVLMIVTALIMMQLPVSEADAATSASDFRIEGSTLVKYRGSEKNVTIPDTVEVIGGSAFEDDKNIELVVLPNSVRRIEAYAFWGCDNLDTVVLGNGLKEVGDYAFAGCYGLKQMSIPANISSIGILAFGDCIHMTDISIPPETSFIHETAFNGCVRLTIHCEEGSAADEFAADFYERQSQMPEFEDVPDSVPDQPGPVTETPQPEPTQAPPVEEAGNLLGSTHVVGNRAVVFVDSTQSQVLGQEEKDKEEPPLLTDLSGYDFNGGIPKYTIVDKNLIADQAYYKNAEITDVVPPAGIREIGEFAFARSSARSVVLPEGLEKIDYGAFYHCDNLNSVTLPETIMSVEPQAFACTPWVDSFLRGEGDSASDFLIEGGVLIAYRGNESNVTIPEGVRVIAGEACKGHSELVSITLPDSLQVVGEAAFLDCGSLEQILFGGNLKSVKDRAFEGTKLEAVLLPSSVEAMGIRAFGDAVVTFEGEEPEHTYESSASRLSNTAYRDYSSLEEQTPGLTVVGLEGASAVLSDMDRSYTLTIRQPDVKSTMENACLRALRFLPPEDMPVYEFILTDESGIPLTKLGKQKLTVTLPVPEGLKGAELRLFSLDKNGQLELVEAEHVLADGVEALIFQTSFVSQFGVVKTGEMEEGVLMEAEAWVENLSPPEDMSASAPGMLPVCAGGVVLTGGIVLLVQSFGKKKV